MDISTDEELMTVEHEYPDFHIVMHAIICSCSEPTVKLTEHINHKWLSASEIEGLDWASADVPIVETLMQA